MTFERARKPTADNRRRVGTILHAGFVADTEGVTALKPSADVTALMTDDGQLFIDAGGAFWRVNPEEQSVTLEESPSAKLLRDFKSAREIYAEREASG